MQFGMLHLQRATEPLDMLLALDTFGPMGIGTGAEETMFGCRATGGVHRTPVPFGSLELGILLVGDTHFDAAIGGDSYPRKAA